MPEKKRVTSSYDYGDGFQINFSGSTEPTYYYFDDLGYSEFKYASTYVIGNDGDGDVYIYPINSNGKVLPPRPLVAGDQLEIDFRLKGIALKGSATVISIYAGW